MRVETMYKDSSKRCGECKNWNLTNENAFKECNKEINNGYREKFYYTELNVCHNGKFEQMK